jgi:membrane-bound lytic murein transglycosylase B
MRKLQVLNSKKGWIVFFIGLTLIFPCTSPAKQSFRQWLDGFYPVAARQGITRATYDLAFAGVTEPDPEVLKKAAYQPEFTTKIWDYLDARVNRKSIATGRIMAAVYRETLEKIEARFGVESSVLLAIWSMESSYGAVLLRTNRLHSVPRALATLAYADPKRKKFAEKQLIAALKILQSGDITADHLTGSWAGAMGHTQFIPTSYLAYGVDMDGDGRRDIWGSIPDALATAASLLSKNGWRSGKTWGYEVQVPPKGARYKGQTKTLGQWSTLGFRRPNGTSFPVPSDNAVFKLIAGNKGPGFLMLRNFFVLKRYNNSDFYALAVGLLADRIAGGKGMIQDWPRPAGSLRAEEKFELQELLQAQGFYSGAIDGHLGPATAKAIKGFQQKNGLAVDGKPTSRLLKLLQAGSNSRNERPASQ